MPLLGEWEHFRPYSAMHAEVVVIFLAIVAVLVHWRRRLRGSPGGRRLDVAVGCLVLAIWVWLRVFKMLPWRWDISKALPLQVCDLAGLMAPLAILTSWRPMRAMLYFWGIGLSSQAFLQPDLREGPADMAFWVFWIEHSAIVGAAIYDLAARRFRPRWRDYGLAIGYSLLYVAVVLPIDIAWGFNYGYLGRAKPGQPSMMDFLGPWPQRVVVILLLVAVVLALMVVPWEWLRKTRDRRALPVPIT